MRILYTINTISVPVVTTMVLGDWIVYDTLVYGGGEVVSSASVVTVYGLCWSLSANPTIADNVSYNGAGLGEFTAIITGLSANTTYHFRAYATNAAGTGYGADVQIDTLIDTPEIFTEAVGTPVHTQWECLVIFHATMSFDWIHMTGIYGGITEYGFLYKLASAGSWTTITFTQGGNPPILYDLNEWPRPWSFKYIIPELTPGTAYNYKAFLHDTVESVYYYGNQIDFTTGAANFPYPELGDFPGDIAITWGMFTAYDIAYISAYVKYYLHSSCGSTVTRATFGCYLVSDNTLISENNVYSSQISGAYNSAIFSGLSPNTLYWWKVRLYNSSGDVLYTADSPLNQFRTFANNTPYVSTDILSIWIQGYTTADGGGTVINDGGSSITARGVCYSTSSDPTIANTHTHDGTGTGSFDSSITGLTAGTTYHFRAYATNSTGTSYGADISFSTGAYRAPDGVTTDAITNAVATSADGGGNVTGYGGYPAGSLVKGICWATSSHPTIYDSLLLSGSANIGAFSLTMTGLLTSTKYYVRAFAYNATGISYGEVKFFISGQNDF